MALLRSCINPGDWVISEAEAEAVLAARREIAAYAMTAKAVKPEALPILAYREREPRSVYNPNRPRLQRKSTVARFRRWSEE